MPQGGVDKGEEYYDAAVRELKEETSIKTISLIKEIDDLTTYLLPNHLIGIIWKGKYKGQKQKWFIVRFNGEEREININTKHPEFLDWKWVDIDDLTNQVVEFKVQVYKKIQKELYKII
jgi:NTP pyrophosphohydrolases including oxidative damage repair enzymes